MLRGGGLVAAALLLVGASSGCIPLTEPSSGELGRVDYYWNEGILGCLFGCDARAPLAVDGYALLTVVGDGALPPFTVSSDAPEVALFTGDGVAEGTIRAEGIAAGRARVVLRDSRTGEVLDRLPLRVGEVDRIETTRALPGGEVVLMVGAELHLGFRLFDGEGREMVGVGALGYELSPNLDAPERVADPLGLSAIVDAIAAMLAGVNHESADLVAEAPGEGTVRVFARSSGAVLEIPFDVITESDVTRISLSASRGADEEDPSVEVTARAWAGDREVTGPLCRWSVEAPATVHLSYALADSAVLRAEARTTARVTCSIGGTSESLEVSF